MNPKLTYTNYRIIFLLTLLLLLAATISSSSAASTIYVNNATGNDDYDGTSATVISLTVGPKATIQNGTNTVDDSGTVYVAEGTYQEHINITKNLSLIGQSTTGTIIDGTNNGRPITINSGGLIVNITNFTITNGNITVINGMVASGGGIFVNGTFSKFVTLTLVNCNILNNTAIAFTDVGGGAGAQGGGIYARCCTLTMINCNINNNTALATSTHLYGGSTVAGGGIYHSMATLNMTNCSIINNSVTAISSSLIQSTSCGGGIYNYISPLILTNCNVANNIANLTATATEYPSYVLGGGIYHHYRSFTLTNCNVVNNTVTATITTPGTSALVYGGGIYSEDGDLTANFNRFADNTPTAIHYEGTYSVNVEDNWWGTNNPYFTSILENVTYPINWLYMTVNATLNTINNLETSLIIASFNNRYNGTTVTPYIPGVNEHIPNGIPVIFSSNLGLVNPLIALTINGLASTTFIPTCYSGIATINDTLDNQTNSTFITVLNPEIYVSNSTGHDDTGDGSLLNPYKTILKGITMVTYGGNVHVADGIYQEHLTIEKNLNLIGQSIAGTIIDGTNNGRPITINAGINVNITNFTIINGNITGITAKGGGIYNAGNLNMTSCNINNNTVSGNDPGSAYIYGGGIYNAGNLNMTSCNINNNTVTATSEYVYASYGGGIYNAGNLNLTSCNINNNTAKATATDIAGLSFAFAYGGGIFHGLNAGNLTMINCNIEYNNATATTIYGGVLTEAHGGGIYSYDGTLTINYSRIVGNSHDAIYNYGGNVVSLEDNWWGSNTPEFTILLVGLNPPNPPINWLYLTVNATPSTVDNGAISQITASFNNRCNGTTVTPFVPIGINHIPDGPVQLDIHSWGSFINPGMLQTIILNTVNGATTPITYYANGGQPTPTSVTINGTADGYTTNGTASATLTINKVANLTITKTGPATVIAGTPITYTITIINNGPDLAESISLTDTIITGLSAFNTGTIQYRWKSNDGDWSSWTIFTNPLSLNLGTINIGKNATIEITGTINSSATKGTIINNTATTNTTTTPGNKTDTIETILDTQADLNVTKTGPATVIAGTLISYIINIENKGPSDALDVNVVDDIPGILENVTHDPFNLGTIAAGTSKTIYINGTVPSSTIKGIIIQNNATVTSITTGTITKSLLVATTVDTVADVDLNKTVNNNRPDVGNTVTFIVTAHNYGPSDATNVQIQDIIPTGFTNVSITPSKRTYDIGTGIWTINLESGEEATLNLTGTVTAIMAGKNTTNNATIISQIQTDPDTLDTANATIYVPKADLYIQITSDKNNPTVGETFILRYKLGNKGPDDALNVTITIPIPDGFDISKIEGDGTWTIVGNNIIWTMQNVTVGDPDLYVSGWTRWAGNFQFGASILSDTFNLNSLGVSSFSLNAAPQVNAATPTSNTVGMQNTGAPIAGIVLAILMVLGGFISIRKKQ